MKKLFALTIVAVFLFAATSAIADSVNYMALSISDGSHTLTYYEAIGGDGYLTGDFTLDGWAVSATVYSYPMVGSVAAPSIHLNTASAGTGTLTVMATVVGFVPINVGGFVFEASGLNAANGASQVAFAAYYDYVGGSFFSWAGQLFDSGFISTRAFDYIASGIVPGEACSYTLVATVEQSGGVMSFDADYNVPEPASLILLGLGLLGIVGIRRKH